MTRVRIAIPFVVFCFGAVAVGRAQPSLPVSGTISSTLSLTSDAHLAGDVTCTVVGAPCIRIDAPGVAFRLNGFSVTGLADPVLGCSGGQTANETGILVTNQQAIDIRGPGIVRQFRAHGIQITGASTKVLVRQVTTSTNCLAGIFLTGGASDNDIEANVSVRNGNATLPCGGI
jgi:hypothetical protein